MSEIKPPGIWKRPAGRFRALSICFCLLSLVTAGVDGLEPRKDVIEDVRHWPMYNVPEIGMAEEIIIHSPELVPLWLKALKTDELDLQRQVADTIVLAKRQGVADLDKMIPTLMKIIGQSDPHPTVLAASCRALVALDHQPAAPQLRAFIKKRRLFLCQIIEPGLARWKDAEALQVWRDRLVDKDVGSQLVLLAIRCLGEVEDQQSIEQLVSIAVDPVRPVSLRIEAARVVGQLAGEPQIASVELLKQSSWEGSDGWVNRLVAAWLLNPSPSSDALKQQVLPLVQQLALDDEGSIASVALASLLAWNAEQVAQLSPRRVNHSDPQVRALIADAIHQTINAERIGQLVGFLEDSYKPTRLAVRGWLIELLAEEELGPVTEKFLSEYGPLFSWQGIEQHLWIMIEVPEVAQREWIIEHINHERPEVFVTSALAARRLKVTAALPVMLTRANAVRRQLVQLDQSVSIYDDDVLEQVCHIFQAFGEMNYAPAEELLLKSIPKSSPLYTYRIRAAATWAVGMYYVDNPDETIIRIMEARLLDESTMPPEASVVKRMAAASLGRMKATESIEDLKLYFYNQPDNDYLKWACAWALLELGVDMEEGPTPYNVFSINWFLEPVVD
jgi:HEAT repeat protein